MKKRILIKKETVQYFVTKIPNDSCVVVGISQNLWRKGWGQGVLERGAIFVIFSRFLSFHGRFLKKKRSAGSLLER